jgi:hypothetical protein
MTGDKVASLFLWVIAVADIIIATAYGFENRTALCIVYVAFAISQAAMAWV